MRWRPRLDSPWLDVVTGVVIAVLGIADVAGNDAREGPLWANVLVLALVGVAVAWRRRTPLAAGSAFVALMLLMSAVLTPPPELFVAILGLLLFPYAVGAAVRGRRAVAYVLATFGVIAAANVAADQSTASDWIFPTALMLAAFAAGRNVVHRTALAVELHEAALRADEQRDAEARRAVAAERRRIAHEMHDVVAHSISVMVVQAGGARRILERDPERAQEAAAQIERTGRETLLEMRRLLGVMRSPGESAVLAPNPNLDGLGDLVEGARAAGLPVVFRVEGERRALSPGLELAAYRVVQDALEDVERVAPRTPTEVTVRWLADALEVAVTDARPDVPFAVGAGPSLVGVRERVALYGGALRTGQRPDGGHEVHVRFPLGAPPATSPDQPNPVQEAQGAA